MADPIPFSFQCDARWDDMLGQGSKRLCTQCNTPVVDLSSMTEEEARQVITTGVCVNYIVRGGQVVYARNERGAVDPEGPTVRARSRVRARGRRLLRWASAAASVAAVGGAPVPGVAHASAAASDESSTVERIRSWVASWFEDESCRRPELEPVRLGGVALVTDPPLADTGVVGEEESPPSRRLVGKPRLQDGSMAPVSVSIAVGTMDIDEAEITCGEHRSRERVSDAGKVAFSVPTPGAHECTVRPPMDPPWLTTFQVRPGAEIRCHVDGSALRCE